MTPKEKAKELIRKFETAIVEELLGGDKLYHYTAKQCALIAVEEILNLPVFWDSTTEGKEGSGNDAYWEEVKTEIENI